MKQTVAGVLCLLAAACGGLPQIISAPPGELPQLGQACKAVFPSDVRTAIHAIEVELPGGKSSSVIGVSALDPQSGALRCVLLTSEGVVLFDGVSTALDVTVRRSLPPLDDKEFAARLFSDVRFMFLAPPGEIAAAGTLVDRRSVCRWQGKTETVDVVLEEDGGWTVLEFKPGRGTLTRRLRAHPPVNKGLAASSELEVKGVAGYRMLFKVIEVD